MTIRVYADGVFDMFHHGHGRVLEQAKKAFPDAYLIAGVHNDEVVHAMKGPTVMTYNERMESMRQCKWVDEVMGDAPWKIEEDFIKMNNIDYVAHDADPYPAHGVSDLYEVPKRMGIFLPTQRTPAVSTSLLIQRILDNVDVYRQRNATKLD